MSASTLLYSNAFIIINGASLATQFNDASVDYKAEMKDRTSFNTLTRERRGGLFMATITGKGFVRYGTNQVAEVLFNLVGQTEVPMVFFPDGINEGNTYAEGFAMMGVVEHFNVSGKVGDLTPFDFQAESAGLGY